MMDTSRQEDNPDGEARIDGCVSFVNLLFAGSITKQCLVWRASQNSRRILLLKMGARGARLVHITVSFNVLIILRGLILP